MDVRPRLLLREISRRTRRNWTRPAGMIMVSDVLADRFRTLEDELKTFGLIEQLRAQSTRRARLRLS